MIIIGNIGNTHSEFATADGTGLTSAPERLLTADLLKGEFPNLLTQTTDVPLWIASVVPQARSLNLMSKARWITSEQCINVDFSHVEAFSLGADRIANVAAAVKLLPLPALIIDCGTAITCELIDDQPAFLGGAILPGRKLLRSALNLGTAQLPDIPMDLPVPDSAGQTTIEAMVIGIDCGVVGAVEAVRERTLSTIDGAVKTYITGGDAAFFLNKLSNVEPVPANFTLSGVAAIAGQHA